MAAHEAEIRDLAGQGMTFRQISAQTGLSYNRVTEIARECGIKARRPYVRTKERSRPAAYIEREKRIIELRQSGMSYSEISEATETSFAAIAKACRDNGLGLSQEDQRLDDASVARIIDSAGFDYVGGYKATHSDVVVRCRECGATFARRFHIFRSVANGTWHSRNNCPYCEEARIRERANTREQEKREAKREAQEARASEKAQRDAEARSIAVNKETEMMLAIHACRGCGREFCKAVTGYNSDKYCSEQCRKQYYYRSHDRKRLARILNREHDSNITLKKLYSRDGGICYICGCHCDWGDCTRASGNFAAGARYPTIDHVIPLSRGGLHVWSNVRLCCKHCNELKGAKEIPMGQNF